MSANVIMVSPRDNVAVAIVAIKAGARIVGVKSDALVALSDIPRNHKVALEDLTPEAAVIKYGEVIGQAKNAIKSGDWVHTHNMKPKEQ